MSDSPIPVTSNLRVNHLLVQLTPIALISAAFFLTHQRLNSVMVGGLKLFDLLLAVAIVLPVFNKMACLPLFITLKPEEEPRRLRVIAARLGEKLPITLLPTAFAIAVTGLLIGELFSWSQSARLAFIGFAILETVFAQLMVFATLTGSVGLWICAWGVYAGTFTVFAETCFLAPLFASGLLLTVLVGAARPAIMESSSLYRSTLETWAKAFAAVPLALLFWGDKLLLMLDHKGPRGLEFIFLGLIPSIFLSHLFFSKMAPHISTALSAINASMNRDSVRVFENVKARNVASVRGRLRLFPFFALLIAIPSIILLARSPWVADRSVIQIAMAALLETLSSTIATLHFSIGSKRLALAVAFAHIGFLACYHWLGLPIADLFTAECVFHLFASGLLMELFIRRWSMIEYHAVWKNLRAG